jgi:type IV pilus assembly protein PilB
MNIDESTIKKALLEQNYIGSEELKKAEQYAVDHRTSFIDYLRSENLVSDEIIGQAVAESFGVPYANMAAHPISKEQIAKIPATIARKYRVILFKLGKKEAIVATDNPTQKGLSKVLSPLLHSLDIVPAFALPEAIDEALLRYRKGLETQFEKIIKGKGKVAPEIVDQIIEDAILLHASDIHIEPQEQGALVRFRIDGVLQEAGNIPREYVENIVNHIKVQSRLRIDEHFAAQDGSMFSEKNGSLINLRTSIVPTVQGEKIVLRVLAAYVQGLNLSNLGLSEKHHDMLEQAARKPFGMILVTGPTGSGKTTTLYALLKMLQEPKVNITTIEDPVEYRVDGINQIQVNSRTNLTFAKGLRSIVRQDPDIILVGEIRDKETAEISVNAALTGHLLLSTFHANDAATAIPRLLDMEIEPFLLASTLEMVIAQRLVRKICSSCRHSVSLTHNEIIGKYPEIKEILPEKNVTLYAGDGCDACAQTGYKGRTAIFEFIQATPEFRDLVLKNPSAGEIQKLAKAQDSISLFEDGLEKVLSGLTTLEELFRVAPPIINKSHHRNQS